MILSLKFNYKNDDHRNQIKIIGLNVVSCLNYTNGINTHKWRFFKLVLLVPLPISSILKKFNINLGVEYNRTAIKMHRKPKLVGPLDFVILRDVRELKQ
jgi:hypothetical protein